MGTACFLERRLMAVYLIQAGGLPIVKIGHAIDVAERISHHQCAHWEELKLIRQWEGGQPEERNLHLLFADLKIRGEWFSFSKAMIGDVGLVEINPTPEPDPILAALPPSSCGAALKALRAVRREGGRKLTAASVASAVGMKRAHLAAIENNLSAPSVGVLRALAYYYDVPVDHILALPHFGQTPYFADLASAA